MGAVDAGELYQSLVGVAQYVAIDNTVEALGTGERSGTMVCDNLYTSDMDFGIIYRTVQKFHSRGRRHIVVKRDEEEHHRLKGGDQCTFYISW